ncbi:uncharacterized protein LOC105426482 [Pogonomyrmex barbatus]|uniref:Uncharacterized protein LOC105426482 n=1 Tax=Pogonomyrmex barbatus TaxID=144034 RepID=A0A6I9WVT7_9HYME|nr:uncharacterized protein LOC105426482 [Pogonomyrmex barbatus]
MIAYIDYLLTHVRLRNALAKNMIEAINGKFGIAAVWLVCRNGEKLERRDNQPFHPAVRIRAGHPPSSGSSTSAVHFPGGVPLLDIELCSAVIVKLHLLLPFVPRIVPCLVLQSVSIVERRATVVCVCVCVCACVSE